LKIKLKGRHFDTIEVIEAESQAMMKTLREHDFQDAFKKWQKCWKRCIRAEGDQMAAPVFEIIYASFQMQFVPEFTVMM
jgi:hypothetical protein